VTEGLGQSREMHEHLGLVSERPTHLMVDIQRDRSETNLFQESKREDTFQGEKFEFQL